MITHIDFHYKFNLCCQKKSKGKSGKGNKSDDKKVPKKETEAQRERREKKEREEKLREEEKAQKQELSKAVSKAKQARSENPLAHVHRCMCMCNAIACMHLVCGM